MWTIFFRRDFDFDLGKNDFDLIWTTKVEDF